MNVERHTGLACRALKPKATPSWSIVCPIQVTDGEEGHPDVDCWPSAKLSGRYNKFYSLESRCAPGGRPQGTEGHFPSRARITGLSDGYHS